MNFFGKKSELEVGAGEADEDRLLQELLHGHIRHGRRVARGAAGLGEGRDGLRARAPADQGAVRADPQQIRVRSAYPGTASSTPTSPP